MLTNHIRFAKITLEIDREAEITLEIDREADFVKPWSLISEKRPILSFIDMFYRKWL